MGYKPRKAHTDPKPTSHGPGRSHAAFLELSEERRAGAAEMDCVIGRARDSRYLLTLFLRPCKVQVALLLPEKAPSAVAAALDMLERALGKKAFQRLFGLVLADNGVEFADVKALERSAFEGASRTQVYYCDVRQSQQKGGCERNHVELRKLLPKGRGISFDDLDARDAAVLMSHLNSEPRASLMGLSPLAMRAAAPADAAALMGALGIEEVPYNSLDMTVRAINGARAKRRLPPPA